MNLTVPAVPDAVVRHAQTTGPLESPWIWAGFALLVVVAAAVAFRYRRRTTVRRWAVAAMVSCAFLGTVTAANSYVGYVRTPKDLALLLDRAGGPLAAVGRLIGTGDRNPGTRRVPVDAFTPIVEQFDLPDPANAVPSGRTYVLLPPGYHDPANRNRRYPVTYLVHGYPSVPEDWLGPGDAPGTLRMSYLHRAISPMIVVSVDLTAGQSGRENDGLDLPGGPRLGSYLANTVVSTIDRQYRTLADRGHRALGGMSGGAFAALNTGLQHLDRFSVLLLTLPYDALTNEKLLAGNRDLIVANTPRDYVRTMPFPYPVSTILTAGTGAPGDIATAHRIADALRARGQPVTVHLERGYNHTWHTARASLPYLLAFADRAFR
ncbi:alpha/beta hydrolase [Amycolatopsis jejuensis]|uniref:alpha/beta hydrolase n=1 Tax=Amycolatopsis jejuensis TaxID=330084 RepID=UPI000A6967E8|nr:alpha/beta hydrolase-fold protein [Amycolatopsis jejuensis]